MSPEKSAGDKDKEDDKTKPKTWPRRLKEIFKVLMNTPRAIALVWKAHPGLMILLILLNIFFGLFPVVQVWISKLLIDTVVITVANKQAAIPFLANIPFAGHILHVLLSVKILAIFSLLGILALSNIVAGLANPAFKYVSEELSDLVSRDINLLIMRKANSFVDIAMFENPKYYDLLQKAQQDASHRPLGLIRESGELGRHLIKLVAMALILTAFQPLLVVAVIVISLPHLIFSFVSQRESWKMQSWESPELKTMWYYKTCLTNEYLAKEVRLFSLGDFFLGRYLNKFAEYRKRHHDIAVKHWRRDSLLSLLSIVGQTGAYSYTVICAVLGSISLGSLNLFTTAIDSIQNSIARIIYSMSAVYEHNLFISNLHEFLDLPETMKVAPPAVAQPIPSPLLKGIEFRNVAFNYEGSDHKVLSDISFHLKPGQSAALVGENGAGKTTLVKLLSRLYDPSQGEIIVDGIDLRACDLAEWRSQIGVIFQNYAHYSMTAQENIGLGQVSHIDDYKLVKMAAERGGADAVIEKLKRGYDTILGGWFRSRDKDEATELSGGEWQKIALARAFMRSNLVNKDDLQDKNHWDEVLDGNFREAQLLILDEPTAALDAQSEHDVYQRFKELTRGKITLLISHRFSTVRMADVILVLENGSITEQGSHDELMEKKGTYARLYALQAARYL